MIRVIVLTSFVLSSAAAGPIWLAGAAFTSPPAVTLNGTGTAADGLLQILAAPGTTGPTIENLPDGFSYTDAQIQYTAGTQSGIGSVGALFSLDWTIARPFVGTIGTWQDFSAFDFSASVPAGERGTVTVLVASEQTMLANEPGVSLATAIDHHTAMLTQGQSSPYTASGASGLFAGVTNPDILIQTFNITFQVSNPGTDAIFLFDSSVDSTAVSTPEPASLTLVFIGSTLAVARRFCLKSRRI